MNQSELDRTRLEEPEPGGIQHELEDICIHRLTRVMQDWPGRLATAETSAERMLYLSEAEAIREFARDHKLTRPADQMLGGRLVSNYRFSSALSEVADGIIREGARADGIKLDVLKPYTKLLAVVDKASVDLYKALFRRPAAFVNYQAVQVQVKGDNR